MQLTDRSVVLIYPFLHDLRGSGNDRRSQASRVASLSGLWQPWWHRLSEDDLAEAISDGYFFLPFVRELLFPETVLLKGATLDEQVREAVALLRSGLDLHQLMANLPADSILHLSLAESMLAGFREVQLVAANERKPAGEDGSQWSARVAWVDVFLYPPNVGFLLLKLLPGNEVAEVEDWANFLNSAAVVHSPVLSWELPQWRAVGPDRELSFTSRDLVDYLLQGLAGGETLPLKPDLQMFLDELPRRRARYTSGPIGQVYGASFYLYSYACLASGGAEDPPAPFASAVEKALFHLVTGLSPNSEAGRPHPRRLEVVRREYLLAFWDNWEGMVFPGRLIYLGSRHDSFTRKVLPRNIFSEYLYLYLFTLFQKLRLSLMNGEFQRRERNVRRKRREAQRLWDGFIRFQNLYWYSEITPLAQGREIYQLLQRGLGTPALFIQMKEEIGELQAYFESRHEQRVGRLLNILTLFGLPASLWVGLFGGSLIADASDQIATSWQQSGVIGMMMLLFVFLTWLMWHLREKD